MMAHYSLQIILNNNKDNNGHPIPILTIPFADSHEAAKLISEQKAGFNLFENNDEYYVVLSIVRMLDVMVGNEPFWCKNGLNPNNATLTLKTSGHIALNNIIIRKIVSLDFELPAF